ncbi:hypothetical protein EVAR_27442_1 [Eumeta japonica]|uniref:Uncharacterized protein n=1 Tax=Eumeta variegata TaxID=151549 RepID=A0A4C1VKG1_EUMVA|nr:hypothetical protein EVAR_27442_1 [Eumeta japonica]
MANLTLRYLDELSYVLNSRRHLANQAKASSVGDLLAADEDRYPAGKIMRVNFYDARAHRHLNPTSRNSRMYRHLNRHYEAMKFLAEVLEVLEKSAPPIRRRVDSYSPSGS